jgi:5-methylcytosine-specific restriction endonuclease McrA
MSEGNAKLKTTKKGKPMYQDSELVKCQECQALGLFAPDLYGNSIFHHKIPSQRNGYFTFTTTHLVKESN